MMAIDVADKGQSCRLLSAPFAVVVACLHYSPICGYGGGGGRWRTGAERHILFVPCRCSASLSCVIFSPCLSLKNGRKDKDMADGNVGSAGRCGDAGRWRSGAGHMYFNRTIKYVFFYFLFCILCLVGDPCCVCSFVSYLSKGARNDVLCDVACMYSHLFISQSVAGAIVGRLHGVVGGAAVGGLVYLVGGRRDDDKAVPRCRWLRQPIVRPGRFQCGRRHTR